jgi:methionine-rich copper-binding protein CopC
MQLSTLFQIETMKLRPIEPTVAVKMGNGDPWRGLPIETGFRLGTIQPSAAGKLEALHLIPTQQPLQTPADESSFAIAAFSVQRANAHQNLQLTAPEADAMRVRLTAQFELLTIQLSQEFEVAAVFLKLRSANVIVSNSAESAGTAFQLDKVEVDATAQLREVVVRALA